MTNDDRNEALTELLRTHLRAPAFPRDEVKERILTSIRTERAGSRFRRRAAGRYGRWPGLMAAAAAAVMIFVAGSEYGRRTTPDAPPRGTDAGAAVEASSLGLPISIQEAGSAYVSRLAVLTARSPSLGEGERRMAEEVAWASLRGAATELARLSEDSEALASLILAIERSRSAAEPPEPSTLIPF